VSPVKYELGFYIPEDGIFAVQLITHSVSGLYTFGHYDDHWMICQGFAFYYHFFSLQYTATIVHVCLHFIHEDTQTHNGTQLHGYQHYDKAR
jgi:hypothetical protein